MNYYNENNKFCVQWLKNLIKEKLISNGEVDDRSILDVKPSDLKGFKQCHFFAGIGGWSYSLRLAHWPDDREVWTGSCPCQPFSKNGALKGLKDPRHLWPVFRWLIAQCKPIVVFGEQVASKLAIEWLAGVHADMETLGYKFGAINIPACSVGAPHTRQRFWWMGYSSYRQSSRKKMELCKKSNTGNVIRTRTTKPESIQRTKRSKAGQFVCRKIVGKECIEQSNVWDSFALVECHDAKFRRVPFESTFQPLAHGLLTNRVGVLRGAGNAIVPQVAAKVIEAYLEIEKEQFTT